MQCNWYEQILKWLSVFFAKAWKFTQVKDRVGGDNFIIQWMSKINKQIKKEKNVF